MRARKHSVTEIAGELGRHRSTIYREVKRNAAKHDGAYRPVFAVEKAAELFEERPSQPLPAQPALHP